MEISITLAIVIVTCLVSLQAFNKPKLTDDLIFYPPAITQRNQWYRFFTYGLIHADAMHLIFNMISLYLFGRFVERAFVAIFHGSGKLLYMAMYVLALLASLLPTFVKNRNNVNYRSLGASGAVSAVVFAGLLIAPYIEVGFFFLPPIIPGFVFGPLYLIISAALDKRGGGRINHSAHIWGALFGLLYVLIVGKLRGNYDAVSGFVEGVKLYFRAKGLM